MHNEAYRNAERFVLERGGSMNVLNQGQALFPESARFVPNNNGTASGMWFEQNGCVVVSLPGVPHEMKQMMTETVLPLLEKEYVRQSIVYKNLLTVGIPESQLAIYLTNWEAALPQTVKLAYLPAPGQVILRLSTSGNNKEELVQLLDGLVAQIPQVVTQQIISYTGETIPQIVGRLLKQQKQSISTAESCTGGSIASAITALSGSSEWFMGSVVAYSNAVKRDVLGVAQQTLDAYGAVSEPVVLAMAEGVKKLTATNWAVSVSGIAGPSGGSAEKPVGTVWVAVSSPRRTIAKRFQFAPTSGREVIITRTVSAALLMVLDEMKL